jgi:dipeptidyl aminopeptidase/acylaminoacyl peptidase
VWRVARTGLAALACACGLTWASTASAAEPVQLTHDGRLKFTPVVVREGTEVIYVDHVDPTLFQLQRLRLSDGTVEPLHPQARTSEFEPAASRDGTCLAYCRTIGVLRIAVAIENAAGLALGEVPPGDGFAGLRSPAVAPDGSRVAFSYAEGGRQQLFSVLPDGSDRRPLTDSAGINNWPSYSPDGQWIAFSSSRDDDYEIYVVRADGSEPRRLTDSPGMDIRPRFSPDGKQIVFTSRRDGNAEIYVIGADGGASRRVTEHAERDDYPDWHPDGRVVFVGERGGRQDLYLVEVD